MKTPSKCLLVVLAALVIGPAIVCADTPAEKPAAAADLSQTASTPPAAEKSKLDHGDNAWILTSSALVLMMTGPGLALFYCGLVRKKNVVSVMMQCVFLMGLMSVIWALYGYTLAFGGKAPILGNLRLLVHGQHLAALGRGPRRGRHP